jgi:hypothetical protein
MIIDGVAAAQTIDTSGELFVVSGADISSLNDGTGVLNSEHISPTEEDNSINFFSRRPYRSC